MKQYTSWWVSYFYRVYQKSSIRNYMFTQSPAILKFEFLINVIVIICRKEQEIATYLCTNRWNIFCTCPPPPAYIAGRFYTARRNRRYPWQSTFPDGDGELNAVDDRSIGRSTSQRTNLISDPLERLPILPLAPLRLSRSVSAADVIGARTTTPERPGCTSITRRTACLRHRGNTTKRLSKWNKRTSRRWKITRER